MGGRDSRRLRGNSIFHLEVSKEARSIGLPHRAMINISLGSESLRLDDISGMTVDCLLAVFPEAKAAYSKGDFCDITLTGASAFGLQDWAAHLTFVEGRAVAVSLIRQHECPKSRSRHGIRKTTIKSINNALRKRPTYNIFTGEYSWASRCFALTYCFYEHFLWEERITIKYK